MASICCSPCGVACVSGTKIVQIVHREGDGPEKLLFDVDDNKVGSLSTTAIPEQDGKHEENLEKVKARETNRVLACRFSPSWKYFAVCDDLKRLHLYDSRDALKLISVRSVARRATSLTFTRDESDVLVADKSGDVYKFSVSDVDQDGQLLLGHLSMLLDIVTTKDDRYIVTCDRDEKIRISSYPNAYNIRSFCLHHTEYVTSLVFIEDPEVIISGGGDGNIMVWNVNGELLTEFHGHEESAGGDTNKMSAIKKLVYSDVLHLLAAIFFGIATIKFYAVRTTTQDVCLEKVQEVSVQSAPWDMCFDTANNLWVLQPVQEHTVEVFHCCHGEQGTDYKAEQQAVGLNDRNTQLSNKVQRLDVNTADNSHVNQVVSLLNRDWDFFKESESVPDFSQGLKKIKIDNYNEYLQKKRDRIEAKSSEVKAQDCKPPEKKIKAS